jgi:hypothetical protein
MLVAPSKCVNQPSFRLFETLVAKLASSSSEHGGPASHVAGVFFRQRALDRSLRFSVAVTCASHKTTSGKRSEPGDTHLRTFARVVAKGYRVPPHIRCKTIIGRRDNRLFVGRTFGGGERGVSTAPLNRSHGPALA